MPGPSGGWALPVDKRGNNGVSSRSVTRDEKWRCSISLSHKYSKEFCLSPCFGSHQALSLLRTPPKLKRAVTLMSRLAQPWTEIKTPDLAVGATVIRSRNMCGSRHALVRFALECLSPLSIFGHL